MVLAAPPNSKINTKTTQLARDRVARRAPGRDQASRTARGAVRVSRDARESVRGSGRPVIELGCGITVYPPQQDGDPWRAVLMENGQRRYREAVTEEKLAKLEKVTERLQADAPNMERPGTDLIAYYLSPGRHPATRPWSRKHADTQRRLCEWFVAPVIGEITACQDIKVADIQQVVNAAPTAGEGARLHRCLSAMVTAGIAGGHLTSPRLKEVHWQAGDRPAPGPQVSVQGESAQFVDPAEIPVGTDVAKLGQALAILADLYELMASTVAYSGLRQGELFALTIDQIATAARVITVDRKVVEVGGKLYVEAPKSRKRRSTIYPARTPEGYPLADKIGARIGEARAEQEAGTNPPGLMFPSPRGTSQPNTRIAIRQSRPRAMNRDPGATGSASQTAVQSPTPSSEAVQAPDRRCEHERRRWAGWLMAGSLTAVLYE